MKWKQGRATLDQMLANSELERVPASRQQADRLLAQSRGHLQSGKAISDDDPPGAYALVYDAARKALTAILENQGLRPTSRGGHIAAFEAVRAQLDPPMGATIRPFQRMRRQRNDVEYPPSDAPEMTADDVREDAAHAHAIVELAAGVLDQMSPY